MKEIKIKKIIVHGGVFHADDVMCVALVRYINPDVEVERVLKAPETVEDGTIVADIGLGRYDNHKEDARVREESGEKYAACGLLLEDIWQDIFPTEEFYQEFVRDYIMEIEMAGDSAAICGLPSIIRAYAYGWNSEDMDKAFMKAVDMLYEILDREVKKANNAYEYAKNELYPDLHKAFGKENADNFKIWGISDLFALFELSWALIDKPGKNKLGLEEMLFLTDVAINESRAYVKDARMLLENGRGIQYIKDWINRQHKRYREYMKEKWRREMECKERCRQSRHGQG